MKHEQMMWMALYKSGDGPPCLYGPAYPTRRELIDRWGRKFWPRDRRCGFVRAVKVDVTYEEPEEEGGTA